MCIRDSRYSAPAAALLTRLGAMPKLEPGDAETLKSGLATMVSFSSYTSVTVKKGAAASFADPTGMKYGFNLPGIFEIVKNPKLGTSGCDWEVDPAGTRLILEDVAPVSYTHLDVYKRQASVNSGWGTERFRRRTGALNQPVHVRTGTCLLYTSRCV